MGFARHAKWEKTRMMQTAPPQSHDVLDAAWEVSGVNPMHSSRPTDVTTIKSPQSNSAATLTNVVSSTTEERRTPASAQKTAQQANHTAETTHMDDTGVKTHVKERNHITFTLQYWTLAKGFAGSFIAAMILGGFVTLVATQYTPETDLVYRFFAKFNPCIFFDHFPANLWGMLLIALFLYFEIAMLTFIYLHRTSLVSGQIKPHVRPCSNLIFLCSMGPIAITFCTFVNIFTANLYEDHVYEIFNATEFMSIQHPNISNIEIQHFVNNLTRDERDGVTKIIFNAVTIHTTWFILYILGDILFTILLWKYANRLRREHSWTYPIKAPTKKTLCCHTPTKYWKYIRYIFFIIYIIGVPSFCLSLTIILFAYDGNNRMVADRMWKNGTPFVQSLLVWFKETANAASWFAIPMLFHHFFVSFLVLCFSLQSSQSSVYIFPLFFFSHPFFFSLPLHRWYHQVLH